MSRLIGRAAEEKVFEYLRRSGYRIVANNVMFPFGELDVVALHNRVMVFIEIKYRRSETHGFHLEAVNHAKRQKIIRAAEAFLQREFRSELPPCRFDVIAVSSDLKDPKIDHIEDAFWVER